MPELTPTGFGLAAAYLIPGFLALSAFGEFSSTIQTWLGVPPADSPTIGGFLYVALASVAAGLLLGAVRWLTLDRLHHATGIHVPRWNFAVLQQNLAAFEGAVDQHLRYYQFYAHTLLAVLLTATLRSPTVIHSPTDAAVMAAVLLPLIALLFVASRDALAKHYLRTSAILGTLSEPRVRGVRRDDQRLAPKDQRSQAATGHRS